MKGRVHTNCAAHWMLVPVLALTSPPLGNLDRTSTVGREASEWTVSVPYEGSRFTDAEVADGLVKLERVVVAARQMAEMRFGRAMDASRVRVRVVDIPAQSAHYIYYMQTYGRDPYTVDVHAEPLLSGAYTDSTALTETMAHEFVHVIARQSTTPDLYSQLPDWLQEGLSILLIGQGERKLGSELIQRWDRPMDLLKGFEQPVSPLAGSFILQETRQRLGPERFLEFVDTALREGSVAIAFSSLELSGSEIIGSAKSSMRNDITRHMESQGDRFAACMSLYREGRERRSDAIRCFKALIEESPATGSAAASHYWLAKCYYNTQRFSDARPLFEKFLSQSDYGLRDDAQYYEIRMLVREKRAREARDACETYFRFYPYGNHLDKVRALYRKLPD